MLVIPETAKESSLTISFLRLTPSICAMDDFCIMLVDLPEFQFIASKGLSNIDHICHHTRAIIQLDKEFDFSPGSHRLDTLSPLAFAPETVDKIAYYYSCLLLEQANNFQQKRIKQKIT